MQGSIPGLERSLGEGNGNPLQYSCLENPMDRGAWQVIVHGFHTVSRYHLAKSQTQLNTHTTLQSPKSYWTVNRTFAKHAWGLWTKSHKNKMCHYEATFCVFVLLTCFSMTDLNQLVLLMRKMKLLSKQRSKGNLVYVLIFFSKLLG